MAIDTENIAQPLVIVANKIQVELEERLLQDLKKLGDFCEHLVKHSTLRFLLKKPLEDVALEFLRWMGLPQKLEASQRLVVLVSIGFLFLELFFLVNFFRRVERHRREETRERHGKRGKEPRKEEIDMAKLVTLEFGEYALVWWTQTLEDIRREVRGPFEDWVVLKRLVRERVVLPSYTRDSHNKLQRLY
ncbi:hypothetical protein CR513_35826, partial [Mucuna pruriens]